MTCHPKDRHVLAAAVAGGAQVVVTFNVKDFPAPSVEPHEIGVVHPDAFLLDQLDLYPGRVGRVAGQLTAAKRPPLTMGNCWEDSHELETRPSRTKFADMNLLSTKSPLWSSCAASRPAPFSDRSALGWE